MSGRDYVTRNQPDNRGLPVGEVAGYERGELLVDVAKDIEVGDGLAFEAPDALGGPTIGWVRAAFRLIDSLNDPAAGADWRTPTLMVLASEDHVVSSPAAEAYAEKLRATHTVTIPGALHEVMQERNDLRDRFWAAFDAFVPGSEEVALTG